MSEPNPVVDIGMSLTAAMAVQRGMPRAEFVSLAAELWDVARESDGSTPDTPRPDGSYGYPRKP